MSRQFVLHIMLVAAIEKPFRRKIAGRASLGTINRGLATALANDSDRNAALISFLFADSGTSLFGIGSALWGLGGGLLATAIAQ